MTSPKSNIIIAAERNLLAALTQNPAKIFDVDKIILDESDFSTDLTKCIYTAIKGVAELQQGSPQEIDGVVIEEKISSIFPAVYNGNTKDFHDAIQSIKSNAPITDIRDLLRIIVTASIRRKSQYILHTTLSDLDTIDDGAEILRHLEKTIFDFTNGIGKCNDVESLCADFDKWIIKRVQDAKQNKLQVGVGTGFPLYDEAIGGGLRPKTINVIAARSKIGKSFLALKMAYNIAASGTKVLYLDTELDKDYQLTRLAGMVAEIPLKQVEMATFIENAEYKQRMKSIMYDIKKIPLDYVVIKGWSIQEQVSIIRRWFAKKVGKNENGEYNRAVVILDYLKLMTPGDRGYDTKEYEALGYHMTVLHDLMSQYGSSMIMLAQQNRSGIDREDESTISGSDRIIWLCDNFSILANKSVIEIDAIEAARENMIDNEDSSVDGELPNMKLKVNNTRHGPGTPNDSYIGLYCDLKDPRKRNVACGILKEKRLEMPFDDATGKK